MPPSKLVLFDIDGTILTTVKKAWMFPFADAIREVLDIPVDLTGFSAGGKTDPQIVLEMAVPHAIPEDRLWEAIPRIRESYLKRLREVVKGPEDAVLKPGVRRVIETLAGRPEAALGLLTGNFEEGARVKLSAHGLNGYFPFGVFGEGARRRVELASRVRPLAQERFGRNFDGKDTVLVGDTLFDIDCANVIGAKVVAVATGPFPLETLKAAGPDYAFSDLSDTERVVEAILS